MGCSLKNSELIWSVGPLVLPLRSLRLSPRWATCSGSLRGFKGMSGSPTTWSAVSGGMRELARRTRRHDGCVGLSDVTTLDLPCETMADGTSRGRKYSISLELTVKISRAASCLSQHLLRPLEMTATHATYHLEIRPQISTRSLGLHASMIPLMVPPEGKSRARKERDTVMDVIEATSPHLRSAAFCAPNLGSDKTTVLVATRQRGSLPQRYSLLETGLSTRKLCDDHGIIKGTFQHHLVTWVEAYSSNVHGIAVVPSDPDSLKVVAFEQWIGSKASFEGLSPAIAGHVPCQMINDALHRFQRERKIFKTTGVRETYHKALRPNESSVRFTRQAVLLHDGGEAYHFREATVPPPSKNNALKQIIKTNERLDKLAAFRVDLESAVCSMVRAHADHIHPTTAESDSDSNRRKRHSAG
ncbi:hypothetical protein OH76DRAFT_1424151 [Lentinus brumalis]|uniref:Uncharacterized protein n=1 Tax=Lentinus brumalis TaxID=2498619 RepID=A0A371CHC7_9APHY|nr:hypothetical protein OH76DRAFT_1424151 [Polyporus brumalis]